MSDGRRLQYSVEENDDELFGKTLPQVGLAAAAAGGADKSADAAATTTAPKVQLSEKTILEMLEDYVQQHHPNLVILTPCYNSQVFVPYMECVMATVELMRKVSIPCRTIFCRNDSLVSRARNNLVAKAMADPAVTHMLFIDNDITWQPSDIIKLMLDDKPIVGGIYPIKRYMWDKLMRDPDNPYNSNVIQQWIQRKNQSLVKDSLSDADMVQFNLVRYNVNYWNPTLQIHQNVAKVRHIATGFMMLQRETIELMRKAFPHTKYVDDVGFLEGEENHHAYALFDCGVEDGHYFSEDWLFCHRWAKMGGDIYANVTVNLDHTGLETFRGSYLASLI